MEQWDHKELLGSQEVRVIVVSLEMLASKDSKVPKVHRVLKVLQDLLDRQDRQVALANLVYRGNKEHLVLRVLPVVQVIKAILVQPAWVACLETLVQWDQLVLEVQWDRQGRQDELVPLARLDSQGLLVQLDKPEHKVK